MNFFNFPHFSRWDFSSQKLCRRPSVMKPSPDSPVQAVFWSNLVDLDVHWIRVKNSRDTLVCKKWPMTVEDAVKEGSNGISLDFGWFLYLINWHCLEELYQTSFYLNTENLTLRILKSESEKSQKYQSFSEIRFTFFLHISAYV